MKKLILCALAFYSLYFPAHAQEHELSPVSQTVAAAGSGISISPTVQQLDQPIYIETREGLLEQGEMILLDGSGRVVREMTLKGGTSKVTLYLHDFAPGQYTLFVRAGSMRKMEKIEFR